MNLAPELEDSAQQAARTAVETGMEALVGLFLLAITVAIIARRIRIPYTVALVLVGLVAGAVREWGEVPLSQDLILLVFLPPLLFEGCLHIDLGVMRRNLVPILLLAVPGTLLTVVALGAVLWYVFDFSWPFALLLGTILAPTDPVSVLATFKDAAVQRDLSVLVEGESVFNDGIGIVLFLILLRIVDGQEVGIGEGLLEFGREVGVGLGVGVALGGVAYAVLRMVEDGLIEVGVSLLLAYGSYIVATNLHGSGVMAVVAAGLIMGNFGRTLTMRASARITLASFWEVAAFIANSLVFLFIGVNLHPSDLARPDVPARIAVGFIGMMVLRAIITYGLLGLSRLWKAIPPKTWILVTFWGGLRGTIPIALVLMTEGTLEGDVYTDTQAMVFGVVLASLLVQGLTIKGLLTRLGLTGAADEQLALAEAQARDLAARAAERELEELHSLGEVPENLFEELRAELAAEREKTGSSLEQMLETQPELLAQRRRHLARQLLEARLEFLALGVRRGIISEEAFQKLRDEIAQRLEEGPGIGGP